MLQPLTSFLADSGDEVGLYREESSGGEEEAGDEEKEAKTGRGGDSAYVASAAILCL